MSKALLDTLLVAIKTLDRRFLGYDFESVLDALDDEDDEFMADPASPEQRQRADELRPFNVCAAYVCNAISEYLERPGQTGPSAKRDERIVALFALMDEAPTDPENPDKCEPGWLRWYYHRYVMDNFASADMPNPLTD